MSVNGHESICMSERDIGLAEIMGLWTYDADADSRCTPTMSGTSRRAYDYESQGCIPNGYLHLRPHLYHEMHCRRYQCGEDRYNEVARPKAVAAVIVSCVTVV